MPAEIVTMADCASNYGVFRVPSASERGKFYIVTWSGSESMPHCTCPAFRYGAPDELCKHQKWVWEHGCFYNPQWKEGTADPEAKPVDYVYDATIPGEKCPACGGPMVSVRRAV